MLHLKELVLPWDYLDLVDYEEKNFQEDLWDLLPDGLCLDKLIFIIHNDAILSEIINTEALCNAKHTECLLVDPS